MSTVPSALGAVRIEPLAAYNLVVDSNVESPSTYAPRAAYLGATFHNDGSVPITNVFAYIGNSTNFTPGIYPRRSHGTLTGFPPDGKFALTHEGGSAGTADATRYVDTIPAGGSITVYWLISYPNVDALGHAVWGPSIKPDDDLWLNYNIWMTSGQGASAATNTVERKVTMRNEISASANKIQPSTANQVPQYYKDLLGQYEPTWAADSPPGGSFPGSTFIANGYWYNLGNVGEGFDNNGDLVPDHNLWMQPVGDPSVFDAACFRLVRTHSLVIVKLISGGEQVYTDQDRLYFDNIPPNNGAVGWVGYEFLALNGPCASQLTPYQEVASGRDNEKFCGDYGAASPAVTSRSPALAMDKTASVSNAVPGDVISYAIAFTNTGPVAVGSPSEGVPLVIQDRIPAGTRYMTNSALASNTLPAGVTNYHVLFSTNNGTTWQTTEPVPATNVTHIQWWLSNPMPTNAFGQVRFSVLINLPYPLANPLIRNIGGLSFGNTTPFLTNDATTLLIGTNQVGDRVWLDNGTGYGEFGNGLQDAGEPGLSNITVSLYFDANTNGVLDAADVFLLSANTGTNGGYLFPNLLDGNFVVAVDAADPDLPVGLTPTTPTTWAVNLDSGRTNPNTVSVLTADFGLTPAFSLDKNLASPAPVYEGQTISYTVDLFNRLPGGGNGLGTNRFFAWGTNGFTGAANAAWMNPTNAFIPPGPDGNFASEVFVGAAEDITVYAMNVTPRSGNITNVQIAIPVITNGLSLDNSTMDVVLRFNSGILFSLTTNCAAAFTTSGPWTWFIDVTSVRAWTWSDFASTNFSVQLIAKKISGNPPGRVLVDAVGFRVTSDQFSGGANSTTVIDPAPLTDTYDINRLQFLSATPPPSSVATNSNPGSLYWNNLGPLYPGGSNRVTLFFKTLQPPNNTATLFTNRASSTNATFVNGIPAGPASDSVITNLNPSGSIGDTVWRDSNANGIQDGGEPGIGGVTVTLSNSVSGLTLTNFTDASGYYLFTVLTNTGTYTVRVSTNTLPGTITGRTFDRDGVATPDAATIISFNPSATDGSDTITDADFGYTLPSLIDGFIWRDVNCNGAPSPDLAEPYLANLTVLLYTNGGAAALATTTTDLSGYFRFVGGFNGNYTIVVTNTTGALSSGTWSASFDSDGIGSANRVSTNLLAGGAARANFGYCQTGTLSIGDSVFYDWNGDGLQTAGLDEGIPNITVYLYRDSNTNGVIEPAIDALVATTITDTNGLYAFTSLPAGGYVVLVDEADPQFPPRYFETKDPDEAGICSVCNSAGNAALTTTSRTDQDFGYQPYGNGSIGDTVWFDANGDGVQSGFRETGLTNIQVTLWVDLNGDGTYVALATNLTDSSGRYLFTSLPDGSYRVRVNTADANLPVDTFGNRYVPTTSTNILVAITDGSTQLTADFGFAALGAIGDTVYFDGNGNGTQDFNEVGVSNVTVSLYVDLNTNGLFDAGETLVRTTTTSANGNYLFSALPPTNYVVVVSKTGPIANAILTADPSSDGVPCTATNAVLCDNQYGLTITMGQNFTGADFGYQPPGIIGDLLWLDSNNNGIQDSGEVGIPYVTIELRTTNGVLVATNVTDPDGNYLFSGINDGTYRVVVLTNDTDFPMSLAPTFDADGTGTPNQSTVTIANGGTDLLQDFGYRYAGDNALSGTVGLDDPTYNGVLGTNGSGTLTNEVPFPNATAYAYLWNDNGNGLVDSGETFFLGTATTATNGDYSFTGLPSGGANSHYLVSLAAPFDHLFLTTTNGATPATSVVPSTNGLGEILSTYQVVSIAALTTNVDFAFRWSVDWDFGDLPQSYSTLVEGVPDGARHIVAAVPNLYLGNTVDTEVNGVPTADASGDGADEDGVSAVGVWQDGASGGTLNVKVGAGAGWLVGWMDFNHNGTFDLADVIINQAVSSTGGSGGNYQFVVTVPTGTISSAQTSSFYARFRLFPAEPSQAAAAFTGPADNGEVEDYRFTFASIGDRVWLDTNGDGFQTGEPGISNVVVFVDLNNNGTLDGGEPSAVTDATGNWNIGGLPDGTYTVRVQSASLPPALVPTYDLDGVGTPGRTAVTITTGASRTDVDFGYQVHVDNGVIGDYVWLDGNGNGLQDANEIGFSNVVVVLYVTNSGAGTLTAVATNVTTASGAYSFTSLPASNYVVGFSLPPGFIYTTPDIGTNDAIDSDALTNGLTAVFTLASGEVNTNVDAGFYQPAIVTGHLYFDVNGNGSQDGGEPNLTNVTVTVTSGTNVVLVATDTNGNWSVPVPPGSVTADVDNTDTNFLAQVPAGYVQTEGDDPTVVSAAAGEITSAGNDGYFLPQPAIALDKRIVSGSPFSGAGNVISYQLIATNTGNVTLTNVSISDPKLGALACAQPATLLPGQILTCTGSYTVTQLDVDRGSVTNTATVTGQPPAGAPVSSQDTEVAHGAYNPAVDVVKTCPAGLLQPGQLLTVTGTVTNTGNITLTNVVVTNTIAALGNVSRRVLGPISLAPGAGMNFNDSYTLPLDSCGPYVDTFVVTATDPSLAFLVRDSDTKACPGTNAPRIIVTRNCPVIPVAPGQMAIITGVVSNAGNVTLTNVLVFDDQPAANTLVLGPIALLPGQSASFTNSYPVPPNCCTHVGVVRASGRDKCFGRTVVDSASAACLTATDPKLTVTRTCPSQPVPLGQPLVFSGTVSNAGNITLTNVTVVNDQPSNNAPVLGPMVLAPGEKASFTGSFLVPNDICATNILSTVTARGLSICNGTNVSASKSTLCPIQPTPQLVVTKNCPATPVPPGGLLSFSGIVSNAGNITLTNVLVVNNHPTNNTPVLGPLTLAPHQATNYSGSYHVCPMCCPPYVDTITASGAQLCNGSNVVARVTTSCPGITTPQLSLEVDCPLAPAVLGQLLFYSGSVSNSGDVTLSSVLVTDNKAGFVTEISALAPKETADFFGFYLATNCGPNVVTLVTATALDACTGGSVSKQVEAACLISCLLTEAPVLIHARVSGGQFKFDFATDPGRTYTVQYSDAVQPVNWQSLPSFLGDGSTVTITDPAVNQKRFYRVLVQ